AVRFCVGGSELNGTLSSPKSFCIALQFHESGALMHMVCGMGRSIQNGSFKGIKSLCVVTGGREDQSDAIVGFCIRGLKFKSMVKGGQGFLIAVEAMEGESLAVVSFCIVGMQVNTKGK